MWRGNLVEFWSTISSRRMETKDKLATTLHPPNGSSQVGQFVPTSELCDDNGEALSL
jgi:hypothetical protein